MPEFGSADPFSTFLNTADRAVAGRSRGPAAEGPDGVSAEGLALIRLLAERGPMRVGDVQNVLELSTVRIAQELVPLVAQELVSLHRDRAGADIVELTERGSGFTEAR